MKRDFNIVRSILLQAESAPASIEPLMRLSFDEPIEDAVVASHIELMVNGNLIEAEVFAIEPLYFAIHKITWTGHDFLEHARNDTIWKKVMAQAKEKGTSMTIVILNGLLSKAAQKYAGLKRKGVRT